MSTDRAARAGPANEARNRAKPSASISSNRCLTAAPSSTLASPICVRDNSKRRSVASIPQADNTEATRGTMTRTRPSWREISVACNPAAPPNANKAKRRGSTPRLVSVRRGVDPRRFALFAFGGAAGLHATDISRQLGLVRVIVPRVASVLSAWGMLATDLRFELSRTHIGDAKVLDGAAVKHLFDEMEAEGFARLRASFAGPARAARSVDMRYGEQVFEITVPLDDVDWSAADPLPQIVERFHRRHEALYTYSMPDQEAVLVNARVAVSGILEELPQEPDLPAGPPTSPETERRIYLDDWIAAPVYAFDRLASSPVTPWPALVAPATITALLRPGDRAAVTPQGWLNIGVDSVSYTKSR